jgi:hypothetical protein
MEGQGMVRDLFVVPQVATDFLTITPERFLTENPERFDRV